VKLGEAAKLFVANAAWRALGLKPAGRVLLDGLSSSDESNRTIAGMFLVQGGDRAVPLLRRELEHPRNLVLVLRIIGDLGAREFVPILRRYATDDDRAIAQAAHDALEALSAAGVDDGPLRQ
jgi:HEAT repeat protein